MRIIACFGDWTRSRTLDNCLGLSDEDNSVSRNNNFMNVVNRVTSRALSIIVVFCTFS